MRKLSKCKNLRGGKVKKHIIRKIWMKVRRHSDTVKLGYNENGYNEHSVITNIFLRKFGPISKQINPVITNPGYNEQKCPVPSCSL